MWDERNYLRDDEDDPLIRENSKLSKHAALKHLLLKNKSFESTNLIFRNGSNLAPKLINPPKAGVGG